MEVELSDGNFKEEVLASSLPVLVDFWASWCGPCQAFAPIIKELAEEYDGRVKVGKLNVDDNPSTSSSYEIMSIPTLVIFKDGEIKDRIIGLVSKPELEEKIKPYL